MNAPTNDTGVAVHRLADLITCQDGAIVSSMLLKKPGGNVTLFAFGAGEGLSEHTTPHDALLVVLDGEAEVTVGGAAHRVEAGEFIPLPADVPHAVQAPVDFKMLLVMLRSD
jgi:quercetin dioxygenase-like cupin family protein